MTRERYVYIPSWATAIIGAAIGVAALLYVAHGTDATPWTWHRSDRVALFGAAAFGGIIGWIDGDYDYHFDLSTLAHIVGMTAILFSIVFLVWFGFDDWTDTRIDRALIVLCLFLGPTFGSMRASYVREREENRKRVDEMLFREFVDAMSKKESAK